MIFKGRINLHQGLSGQDGLGEPDLGSLDLCGVTAAEAVHDEADGDAEGAEAVEDGPVEAAKGREGRIDVERVRVPGETVQGSLRGTELIQSLRSCEKKA